jgi:outer membrane receptor protein involved in Fe transport
VFEEESKQQRKLVYDNSRVNELQVRHYFRTDLRIGYRKNRKRVTDELAIDLQNVTNRKNIFGLSFDVDKGTYTEILLQGFMPMVTYRVNFSL